MPEIATNVLPKGVYLWRIEETVEQLHSLVRLNPEETARFAAIKQPSKVVEKLAVRALLQNATSDSSAIIYTMQGRPTIHECEISISHGSGYAVIYLSDKAVGIDLESTGRKAEKLRDRIVSIREEDICKSVFPLNPMILAWCAKESMFKALKSSDVDFVKELVIESAISDRIFGSARGQKMELQWAVIDDIIIVWSV